MIWNRGFLLTAAIIIPVKLAIHAARAQSEREASERPIGVPGENCTENTPPLPATVIAYHHRVDNSLSLRPRVQPSYLSRIEDFNAATFPRAEWAEKVEARQWQLGMTRLSPSKRWVEQVIDSPAAGSRNSDKSWRRRSRRYDNRNICPVIVINTKIHFVIITSSKNSLKFLMSL